MVTVPGPRPCPRLFVKASTDFCMEEAVVSSRSRVAQRLRSLPGAAAKLVGVILLATVFSAPVFFANVLSPIVRDSISTEQSAVSAAMAINLRLIKLILRKGGFDCA